MADLTNRIRSNKQAMLDAMASADKVEQAASWEELSCRSVERMVEKAVGTIRAVDSHGSFRLHGDSVAGHAADLDGVGSVMMGLQRAITSVGAFLSGRGEGARGKVSAWVSERTQMQLVAQPAPGSIVLEIKPKVSGMSEAFPNGETLFGFEYPDEVLADASMEKLIELLGLIDENDIEPFLHDVGKMGTRAAVGIKTLLKTMAESGFDCDVSWHEPGKPWAKVSVHHAGAAFAYKSIEAKRLDAVEEVFRGKLITVSTSASKRIDLETEVEGEMRILHIKKGLLSDAVLSGFPVTSNVAMTVRSTEEVKPGGDSVFIYEALSIEPWEPNAV